MFLLLFSFLLLSSDAINVQPSVVAFGKTVTVSWTPPNTTAVWSTREIWTSYHHGEKEVSTMQWLDDGCWVGLYPAGASLKVISAAEGCRQGMGKDMPCTATAPWRYIPCERAYQNKSFVFTMDSKVREDIKFALFDGGYETPTLLEVSDTVQLLDKGAPSGVHLARLQDPSIMAVQWQSMNSTLGDVRWGSSPGKYTGRASSDATTITPADVCGFPANATGWAWPGYHHYAEMTGLTPGQTYYYRVSNDGYSSDEYHFTAPTPPSPQASLFAVILADMGEDYMDGSSFHWSVQHPDAKNTTGHMINLADKAEVVLHAGDIAYATGYQSTWDLFMTAVEPLASRVPYMTGKGNHEQDWPTPPKGQPATHYKGGDSGGECGVPTDFRFRMPVKGSGNSGFKDVTAAHGFYSFAQGPVHFVMLNTEMPCGHNDDMTKWLQADLASVDRSVTPWLVVLGHRQMWDSSGGDDNLKQLEALFVQYKVDVAFWGHIHYAEVMCPMVSGFCVNETDAAGYDAPIHAVIGNAGMGLSAFPDTLPEYDLFNQHEWGFTTIEAHGATKMTVSLYGDGPTDQAPPLRYHFDINRKFPRV